MFDRACISRQLCGVDICVYIGRYFDRFRRLRRVLILVISKLLVPRLFSTGSWLKRTGNCIDKMNVLVYNGTGTSPEFVKYTIETLRLLLEPYYAVSPVSARVLQTEPWMAKSSVVVFPGGADLPYTRECKSVIPKIKEFVAKEGGVFIGICAGGYFGSSFCEFAKGDAEYEVTGRRELQLFPGTARGPAFRGFRYNKEEGAKTVKLNVYGNDEIDTTYSYYNGGAVFVDGHKYANVEVLAEYDDELDVSSTDEQSGRKGSAVVLCSVGKGKALLSGAHPEVAATSLKPIGQEWYDKGVLELLHQNEESRFKFMKYMLKKAGLKCNSTTSNPGYPDLTPLFVAAPNNQQGLQQFRDNLKANDVAVADGSVLHLKGEVDEFDIYQGYSNDMEAHEKLVDVHPEEAIKQIIFPGQDESIPAFSMTPHFDMNKFFEHLNPTNTLGSILIYGDVVTSTSVLLDQNKTLLSALPDNAAIHVGTIQLLGRGRGGNTWVNPKGVLASTTCINLPLVSPSSRKPISIVFVQYLAMLAYCKAIRSLATGYEDLPVKIKWPNDLYALKPEYYYANNINLLGKKFPSGLVPLNDVEPAFVKVSGLLVTTNFINGNYSLLLGCGINVSNEAPTTSLATWVKILNNEREAAGMELLAPIEHEKLLARYLNELDVILKKFLNAGASGLLSEYYKYWMHSDQIVQLMDHNYVRAKIVGITEDYGLLIAKELVPGSDTQFTGNAYHLQPDGNTFDIFKGLISKKA